MYELIHTDRHQPRFTKFGIKEGIKGRINSN